MQWYTDVLKRYVDFSGRARRQEFWMFQLFNVVIVAVLYVIDIVINTNGVLAGLYVLGTLLPHLGVTWRRLHDTNHSGWWYLIGLVPCVGAIILIVFYATEGVVGDNQYGPDPKAAERGAPPAAPGYPTV
ncbi:DUF805 domain-containing protein [Kribbella sp. NPDC006257]|uniref:DUF805 domain-containing protein n=1 Tax=Kribbella sp. NPDC006257 TaxID=3156738 RepID=UPI0033A55104